LNSTIFDSAGERAAKGGVSIGFFGKAVDRGARD